MSELRYTKDHETIFLEDNHAYIGITPYATDLLGDLVYIEISDEGKDVKKGDEVAVVESVKTAAEILTPVNGKIVAVNSKLASNLDDMKLPVNEGGWILKIEMSDSEEDIVALMDQGAYEAYLEECD